MKDFMGVLSAFIGLLTAGISAWAVIYQRRKPEAHYQLPAAPSPSSYHTQPPGGGGGDPFSFGNSGGQSFGGSAGPPYGNAGPPYGNAGGPFGNTGGPFGNTGGPAYGSTPGFGEPAPFSAGPPPAAVQKPLALRRAESFAAVRDGALIFLGTVVLGFLVGLGAGQADARSLINIVDLLSIAVLVVGFSISAVRAHGNRWSHLGIAGLVVWVLTLISVLAGVLTVQSWFLQIFLVALCAGIGGGISYIFRRR